MKQVNIPSLGSVLILTKDWKFGLYAEKRNKSLLDVHTPDVKATHQKCVKAQDFKLPAGSQLLVDRVFLRQRREQLSSVTFQIVACPIPEYKGTRFWACLGDVNAIEYDEGPPQDVKPFFGKTKRK